MNGKEKLQDPEHMVEHANEQILIEDGEVIPRTKTPRERVGPRFRANKRVAAAQRRAAKAPKPANKPASNAKRSAKKASKKTVKKAAKKAAKNFSKRVVTEKKKAQRA